MIKAILFDLDDTLLDRTTSLEDFVQQQHRRYKLDHVRYAAYRSRFLELDQPSDWAFGPISARLSAITPSTTSMAPARWV